MNPPLIATGSFARLCGAALLAGALARGEDVAVIGFSRFSRKSRPAREGRNPRTGEPVAIGPSATVSFKAGKALKEALN